MKKTAHETWILLSQPFKVISENKSHFIIWFLFTIVAGQFGVLANMIIRYYASAETITYSLYLDTINGSFYTFSIALVALTLGPIFINFLRPKIEFKTLKTFMIILSIFFLFITGIIYASVQSRLPNLSIPENFRLDITQLATYLIAISLVSYAYCILKLEESKLNFNILNDPLFNEVDDQKVEETIQESQEITEDPNGIKL